jgi:PEP-CTERM/exosortase A-associated glycosyltransferase
VRILHLLDHSIPLQSGYTFRTCAILRQQREFGWETFHLTGPKHQNGAGGTPLEEQVGGFDFFRTPAPMPTAARLPLVGQWATIGAMQSRLEQVLPAVRPDILHAHSPALNGVAATRVGRRHGIPVVYEVRAFWEDAAADHGTGSEGGVRYRLSRALETRVLQRADAVITICNGLRGEIVSRGIPLDRVTVVPNAVDIERFRPNASKDEALARELGLEGKNVVGFIGSFYAYEGLTLLVRSMPDIVAQDPDVRLLLVGGGPDEPRLKELVSELSLGEYVIFTGRVPHDQVQRYYDLIDVFAYPRYSMRLTELVTPLKPLEAMAQGKMVVASDVGGHQELITPGETGELFKAGDAKALSHAVLRTLRHKENWPRRIAAARKSVEEERNWPDSVERYRQVYLPLLDKAA